MRRKAVLRLSSGEEISYRHLQTLPGTEQIYLMGGQVSRLSEIGYREDVAVRLHRVVRRQLPLQRRRTRLYPTVPKTDP